MFLLKSNMKIVGVSNSASLYQSHIILSIFIICVRFSVMADLLLKQKKLNKKI